MAVSNQEKSFQRKQIDWTTDLGQCDEDPGALKCWDLTIYEALSFEFVAMLHIEQGFSP